MLSTTKFFNRENHHLLIARVGLSPRGLGRGRTRINPYAHRRIERDGEAWLSSCATATPQTERPPLECSQIFCYQGPMGRP